MTRVLNKLSLNRFHPLSTTAVPKVNELIAAGATLTSVERGRVQLRRMESLATIDVWGRVTWEAAPRSSR